jgi:hypothetical protein
VIDERHEIGVIIEVRELGLHVPAVDVYRDRAELVGSQHGLEKFDAVVELEPDVVTPTDTSSRKCVREPGRSRIELRVRTPARGAYDRRTLRNGVGDPLEQFGEVVTHGLMVGAGSIAVYGPKTLMRPSGRHSCTAESLYAFPSAAARKNELDPSCRMT